AHKDAKPLLGRSSGRHLSVKRGNRAAPRISENCRIKLFLVPEMIVDRRNVGLRPLAYFADRGVAKAVFGEYFSCRLQQALSSFESFVFAIHRTIRFKQAFQTSISNVRLKHLLYLAKTFSVQLHKYLSINEIKWPSVTHSELFRTKTISPNTVGLRQLV